MASQADDTGSPGVDLIEDEIDITIIETQGKEEEERNLQLPAKNGEGPASVNENPARPTHAEQEGNERRAKETKSKLVLLLGMCFVVIAAAVGITLGLTKNSSPSDLDTLNEPPPAVDTPYFQSPNDPTREDFEPGIEAYVCDTEPVEFAQMQANGKRENIGRILVRVCVRPNQLAQDEGMTMQSIDDFLFYEEKGSIRQSAIESGAPSLNLLTTYDPVNCLSSLMCTFETVLFAAFFGGDPGVIRGIGNATMVIMSGDGTKTTSTQRIGLSMLKK